MTRGDEAPGHPLPGFKFAIPDVQAGSQNLESS